MFALSRIRRHVKSCWYSRYMHFGYDFFNSIIAFRSSRIVINGTRSMTGVALCSFLRSGETLVFFPGKIPSGIIWGMGVKDSFTVLLQYCTSFIVATTKTRKK